MPRISKKVLVVSVYGLLLSISTQMLYSQLTLYLKYELNAAESQIAFIDGFVEFISYLIRIFSGILSDYLHDRKILLIIGCAVACVVKPFFAMSQSVVAVLYAEVVERLGNGIQACPRDALIADLSGQNERASSFGFFKSLKTLGAFAGAMLSVIIMYFSDYNTLFLCAGIPAIFAIFVLLGVKTRKQQKTSFENPFQKKYMKSLDKSFWKLIVLAALCELGHFGESLLIIRASEIFSLQYAGMTVAFTAVGQAIFAYPIGLYADKYGKLFTLKICLVLIILSYALMLNTPSVWSLFFCVFVLCGQQASLQNLFLSLISENISSKLRGTAIGVFYCVIGASYMTASEICGQLWEYGGHKTAFLYSIIMSFAGLVAALRLR